MSRSKRTADVNDLLAGVAELAEQVQVLVAAVDDLRCEVEWLMRNTVHADPSQPRNGLEMTPQEEWLDDDEQVEKDSAVPPAPVQTTPPEPRAAPNDIAAGSPPSACSELEKLEQALMVGPRAAWPEEWEGVDPPELPIGHVVPVDETLWTSVFDLRPAHVVGFGCDCEADEGTPYLLAWQTAGKCFLRELCDNEARALQAACLAAQAEQAADHETTVRSVHRQQALW
jgi:hypothetical protein